MREHLVQALLLLHEEATASRLLDGLARISCLPAGGACSHASLWVTHVPLLVCRLPALLPHP